MANWSWPTNAPADARRNLPVFSLTPNWKGGVLERLEWLTDVMSSEIAVEQRRAVRRYPRRSFEANFMRIDGERARLDNFLTGIGRNKFLVPLWHEQFKLPEHVGTLGVVYFPEGTLVHREFAVGDLVMLSTDANRFAILTVTHVEVANDLIALAGLGNVGTWPVGSRITPLRTARILDPVSLSNPSERVGQSQLRFSLSDADSRFPASWGYCAPLWRFNPDRATEITNTYERSAFMLDMGAGVIEVTDPGNRAQITTSMSLSLYGREEIAKFRSFLYMARGKTRRFYVPSYTRDLTPIEDILGSTFDVAVNGFSNYMPTPQEARRIVSVVFADGRPTIYRNVVAVAPVNSPTAPFPQIAERFTVEPDMPPIFMNAIARMSFVVPSRFDQDSFEILHVTDSAKGAKAAVVMKSSIVDGMPSIECWVTSRPYPVVLAEGLNMSGMVLGGSFLAVTPLDSMDMSGDVLSGDLDTVLGGYEMEVEEIESSGDVLASELNTVYRLYDDWPIEEIASSGDVLDGELEQILITQIMVPESIDIFGNVLGGTLS